MASHAWGGMGGAGRGSDGGCGEIECATCPGFSEKGRRCKRRGCAYFKQPGVGKGDERAAGSVGRCSSRRRQSFTCEEGRCRAKRAAKTVSCKLQTRNSHQRFRAASPPSRCLSRFGQFTRIGHIPGGGGHFCGRVARLATGQGLLHLSGGCIPTSSLPSGCLATASRCVHHFASWSRKSTVTFNLLYKLSAQVYVFRTQGAVSFAPVTSFCT